jgi:predicted transcriptional regulator
MVIAVQVPEELGACVDAIVQHTGVTREQLVLEALEVYLADVTAEAARIAEARAQIARGEGIEAEEIEAEDAVLLARLGVTPEQLVAIDEEVRREAEALYGISLCE